MTDTNKLLAERGKTHGDYTINATVSQGIMDILQEGPSYQHLTAVQRETLHMFAHKMARIVGGDPNEEDHWRDIAGYATLAADRLPNIKHAVDFQEAMLRGQKQTTNLHGYSGAVPAEDSNRHANRLRRQVNHSELMALAKEDQLRYRWTEGEQSYVLQPGKVVDHGKAFLPEKIPHTEWVILPSHYQTWYTFNKAVGYWYLTKGSDHD